MKTIAIYSGSFNPFHIGHKEILDKAKKMFDEVIVAVGLNPEKYTDDEICERVGIIEDQLPNDKVEVYYGFVTDFIKEHQDTDTEVVLVRGLRNGEDLNYELQQIRFIEDLYPEINIAMIPCSRNLVHVSSSMIRAIGKFDENKMSKYLP